MNYIATLNQEQRAAVLNGAGPMMIIAGAGSGKTRVLTYRIAHLIENGIEPFNILALTFTNKASREMRERIEKVVGHEARNLWMGTFHSVFAKILRFEGERLGYTSNFTIYDTDDSKSVIKSIVKEMQLDDKTYRINSILSRISHAKNNLISWQKYLNNPQFLSEDQVSQKPKFSEIFKEYSLRCFKANAMDFDDLLFNTNLLFNDPKNADILNKYQHRFEYVLIDEFQDTSYSQYVIIKRIAAVHQNICVVGDDAQSIYAFRGADIQNILNFKKEYSDLKTFKLEQNYRSTQNIVAAANSIIKHNTNQLPKKVWTENQKGKYIQILKAVSHSEEAKLIANHIFEEKVRRNLSNHEFAILYRTNSQSRTLEEALRLLNINYKIIGGLSFYQRREVRDLIAYLRFTINTNDVEAFKRIINLPKRGIGQTTLEKVILKSVETGLSIWDIISNIRTHFGKNRFTTAIDGFATLIKSFHLAVQRKNAYETALQIAKNSGMLQELYNDKSVEGRSRYENLQELLNAVKAFTDDRDNEDKSLSAFVQQVSLLTSQEQNAGKDSVTLMTIHMSKGLEFKYVYIAGMEENLFPSQMMLASREDLEEERRLFYVAVTRAKERLILSYALQRYRFGKLLLCDPSRFLEEVDKQYIRGYDRRNNTEKNNTPETKRGEAEVIKKTLPTSYKSQHIRSENFYPSQPSEIQAGQRVEHPKFGFGIVLHIEEHDIYKRRAKINFENFGEKTLILSFAKLRICK